MLPLLEIVKIHEKIIESGTGKFYNLDLLFLHAS